MVNDNLRCGSAEPHESHLYETKVHYHCSGKVKCGAEIHEPHMFQIDNVKVRCPGVCGCTSFIVHSPGDHK